ncbi:MAG: hypothetical protein GIX00_08235 [Candidatus Eremiobacteraeota bacterium]|nr:hypothetical protein [Candidatus Eremiobacteraeota bacterium]
MTKERIDRAGAERGVALITVIGLMLVLLIFAGGLVSQLAMEVNSVHAHGVSNRALTAADAGVHGMVAAIQTNAVANLPPPNTPLEYDYPEANGAPSNTSYTATIARTWITGSLTYYLITSTGSVDNGIEKQHRVVSAIARAQPYARYASFSNYEVNQFGKPVWYLPDQVYDGPVYSGGPMHIDFNDTVGPIFKQGVQTGYEPIWNDEDEGKTQPDARDWDMIAAGGQNAFAINPVPLALPQPSSNIIVASEAWQGDASNTFASGFPSVAPGVYIDAPSDVPAKDAVSNSGTSVTTGIFINAAGGTATVTSSSSGNTENMSISGPWSGGSYDLAITFGSPGSTKVTYNGVSKTYSGVPSGAPAPGNPNLGNGAVFAVGGIQFGKAKTPDVTLQGSYTFATPDYAGWTQNNNIVVLGNLKYADPIRDEVALWGNDVIVDTLASDITIDASIIAGYPGENWKHGNFRNIYCKPATCGTRDQGKLTVNGGVIENSRGALGLIVGTPGTHTGFSRNIIYDPRLQANPPPFNPTTGAYNLIAWDDLGS